MGRRLSTIIAVGLAWAPLLSSCDDRPAKTVETPGRAPINAGYQATPAVTGVQPAGARVLLVGVGAPSATVRLATPAGETTEGGVDAAGRWRLTVPAGAAIYSLSERDGGRSLQAQGYLLVTGDGRGVMLRSGSSAAPIGSRWPPKMLIFDFDRDGGAMVSGSARAGGRVSARIDGDKAAEGRAGNDGRFTLSFTQPLAPGVHGVKVLGDEVEASLRIDTSPAPPLTDGPLRIQPSAGVLRVDWMTPGGGVQSTLLVTG